MQKLNGLCEGVPDTVENAMEDYDINALMDQLGNVVGNDIEPMGKETNGLVEGNINVNNNHSIL